MLAGGCVAHRAAPSPPAPPASRPVAVAARLELEPLGLSPDGELRLLVRLRYTDRFGFATHVPPGGHVDVTASRGSVAWQPRARFGDPAAIVRLSEAGPLSIAVRSDLPRLPHLLRARTDTRAWRTTPVTARALGARVVVIGWFPRVHAGVVRITRVDRDGRRQTIATIAAPSSSFRDGTVLPRGAYTYIVTRPHTAPIDVAVDMPPDMAPSGAGILRGKAMWVSFGDEAARWDVPAMIARARAAGIRAIVLRLVYGEYGEITPLRKGAVDRFIDAAARQGIATVAWSVPRANTYEDLAAAVAAASYRTPAGHGPAGIAADLERGADFFAEPGPHGANLARYIANVRSAVGPHALVVATVEDPYFERLPDGTIPYAAIAAQADVLQPMTYWRMRGGRSIDAMRADLARSYATIVRLAARDIPIDIGGQTADLGNGSGAPGAPELAAAITTARDLGALGMTLFDWDATTPAQWQAIAAVRWADGARLDDRAGPAPKFVPAGRSGGN